jgi:hypothetical protein
MMPPSTDTGIDFRNPEILPTTEKRMAVTADIWRIRGFVTFVSEMAPVTSE